MSGCARNCIKESNCDGVYLGEELCKMSPVDRRTVIALEALSCSVEDINECLSKIMIFLGRMDERMERQYRGRRPEEPMVDVESEG